MKKKKLRVAKLSIFSNLSLTIFKLMVGLFMGSISVISEAMHSGIDLVAAVIAYLSVRQAVKPADEAHPYGHGKFENVGSVIEAILIIVTAVAIIYQAVPRVFHPTEVHSFGIGIAVMAVSILVNILVSHRLMKVAKETDSPALEGDALHLRADVYTALGIFTGLLAIKLTGLMILDPLIAIAVSLFILRAGVKLSLKSFKVIVDESFTEEELLLVQKVLGKNSALFLNYHQLRTRKAGSQRFIDMHLVFPKELSIQGIHDICEDLENQIKNLFIAADVVIKVEPCQEQCDACDFSCSLPKEEAKSK